MEYKAESKNIRISPRKVRLVADSVRELSLDQAIASLTILNKRAADPIRKTLESAAANAVNNFQANKADLHIKEILVGEGSRLRRYHYAARGRVRPYVKRTSHIRVILEDMIVREPMAVTAEPVAEPKNEGTTEMKTKEAKTTKATKGAKTSKK